MTTILVIEDNPYIAESLARIIEMHIQDSTVFTARNGREGAALMDSVPADLVITDLQMPVADGYSVIEHRNRRHPGVPLVAMTAALDREVKDRLKGLGIRRCLEKPFDFDAVRGVLAEHLREGSGAPPLAGRAA